MTRPCSRCGGDLEEQVDHDGMVEVCRSCGAVHLPAPVLDRGLIRRLARQVVAADRRGEL